MSRCDLILRSRRRYSDDGVSKGEVAFIVRVAILRDARRRQRDGVRLRMRAVARTHHRIALAPS